MIQHENVTIGTQKNLILNLLTTHLLNLGQQNTQFFQPNWYLNPQSPQESETEQQPQQQAQTQNPSVFIIAPPKSTTISEAYNILLQAIQTSQSIYQETHTQLQNDNAQMVKAEDIALQILEQVNLLQYLDLTGLAESISEVSSILASPSCSTNKSANNKTIILVEGFNATISRALNRSSPSSVLVRTAGLATSIFRSLRHLVQSNSEILILVELEIGVELARTDVRERGDGLKSVFADGMGRTLRVGVSGSAGGASGGAVRRAVGSNYAGGGAVVVLERIVENALDGVVIVHDGFKDIDDGSHDGGRMIVEVMKDAMGDELGSWTIWPDGT